MCASVEEMIELAERMNLVLVAKPDPGCAQCQGTGRVPGAYMEFPSYRCTCHERTFVGEQLKRAYGERATF